MDPSEIADWMPRLEPGGRPLYLQIATAIEDAIAAGRLRPGDRLPSQRLMAETLGIDLTTATRAYAEARRRHLLDAVTGRGSFVAARPDPDHPPLDLAMNIPPRPRGLNLGEMLRQGIGEVLGRTDPDLLMSYHPGAGLVAEKAAGAVWLAPVVGTVAHDRIAVAPGAQAALTAILSLNAAPGDTVLCEALTYPGLIDTCRLLRLKLRGVVMGPRGMRIDALSEAARETGAKIVCVSPSMQNPTASTMSGPDRAAFAATATDHGLTVIEDDPYGLLAREPIRAIAAMAPAQSWHIATLSKCLTPGLRTAFVTAPDANAATRLAGALRALTLNGPPLMAALAARWIRDGSAEALRDAVRVEAEARQLLARALLPPGGIAHESGLHVWQHLPAHWNRKRLIAAARRHGLGLMPSDAFAVDPAAAPDAVRLSLGAIPDRARLRAALETLAAIMNGDAAAQGAVAG
ncbi:hypothetical protein sos41_02770 [Alphaproteobacteria bacterium SO-S41]|nr:hypothetical protein sos41_02770 [Alphaproteobacteria bacterium SO-S41]